MKHIPAITFSVPKIFVYQDCFFFLAELRTGRLNFINKWVPCVVQLMRNQIRVYHSVAEIVQNDTITRVNLHCLMVGLERISDTKKINGLLKKSYKNCMYYYIKLMENDITSHRVLESKPTKYRQDISRLCVNRS